MRTQSLVPFWMRVEVARLRRLRSWWRERSSMARTIVQADEKCEFVYLLACNKSPLERAPGAVPMRLQRGKVRNITIAAARLDGLIIHPKEVFSYHHVVGRP